MNSRNPKPESAPLARSPLEIGETVQQGSGRGKPLAVELFAGTGSGTAGWCELGGEAVCFDLEYLPHHGKPHKGQRRVIQDVLTLHGSQFKDAAFIWASPPCQRYSYLAMPWSRSADPENSKAAKALRKKWETEGPDNRLFDACFRIQREAIEATRKKCGACSGAGRQTCKQDIPDCPVCRGKGFIERYIPLIVENVRGAVPWVGPSKANYGSFHLWGDVAQVGRRIFLTSGVKFGTGLLVPNRELKNTGGSWFGIDGSYRAGARNDPRDGLKTPGRSLSKGAANKFGTHNMGSAEKIMEELGGTKIGGDWFSDPNSTCRKHGSKSNARKAASALIAKIPEALSRYVAEMHWPG